MLDFECNDDDDLARGDQNDWTGGGSSITLDNAPDYRISSSNYQGTSGYTEVHHIVEQCQTSKSGFDSTQIQSNGNKIALDYSLHRQISGFYSSKPEFTDGLRVRDWLAGQSYAEQTAFGWKVINYHYALLRM